MSFTGIVSLHEGYFEDLRSCRTYYNRTLFVNVVKIVTGCVIVLCAVRTRKNRKLKTSYQVADVSFTLQQAVGGVLPSGRSN